MKDEGGRMKEGLNHPSSFCLHPYLQQHLHRLPLRRLDGENAVQPRDLEQFKQLRPDAAEDELAVLQRVELLVEREDDADRLRGEVLHFLEVEDDAALVLLVDEPVQLLADL